MINFSIIIPHKNAPDLLKRCLESIPQRPDVQIIVVDDNSDSRVVDWNNFVIEGKSFELVKTTKGGGAGYARNEGLKYAKGKWVLFADCDDYYCDNFLNVLEKYNNSDVDVVFYNCLRIDSKQKERKGKRILDAYLEAPTKSNTDRLRFKSHEPWNKMVRNSYIKKYSIHFEECLNGNDIFYSFQVGYFCENFAVEEKPIYCYLYNPASIIHKKKNSDAYYLCILMNRYKCNAFYDYIGHKDWKRHVFVTFSVIMSKRGIRAFWQAIIQYALKYKEIRKNSNMYVDYFDNKNRNDEYNNF